MNHFVQQCALKMSWGHCPFCPFCWKTGRDSGRCIQFYMLRKHSYNNKRSLRFEISKECRGLHLCAFAYQWTLATMFDCLARVYSVNNIHLRMRLLYFWMYGVVFPLKAETRTCSENILFISGCLWFVLLSRRLLFTQRCTSAYIFHIKETRYIIILAHIRVLEFFTAVFSLDFSFNPLRCQEVIKLSSAVHFRPFKSFLDWC